MKKTKQKHTQVFVMFPRMFLLILFLHLSPPLQIPSQCMTCVAFQAVREYIVGKTAPVPVKIYDYYEPGVPPMNI